MEDLEYQKSSGLSNSMYGYKKPDGKLKKILSREKTSEEESLLNGSDYQKLVDHSGDDSNNFEKDTDERKKHTCCSFLKSTFSISKRYQIALLSGIGFLISFGIRCNMGVAMVTMVHNQTKTDKFGNVTVIPAKFHWGPGVIAALDSSFFWGYLVTQIPGGYLAAKLPANKVFGFALGISAFLNCLIPVAAKYSPVMVIFVRIAQGLVEGVTYPAVLGIWRYWAPPLERSRLATLTYTGSYAGAVLGLPLSGIMTENVSWESSFYFYGVAGVLWFISWYLYSSDKPANCPGISKEEVAYIEEAIAGTAQAYSADAWVNPPWKAFFTSMPVWAIIVANFCRSWSFYLLINDQAKYFREALGFSIGSVGFAAALPHLTMSLIVPFAGYIADYLRKHYFSTTIVRKIMNCGGFGLEAVFLAFAAYYSKSLTLATALLTLAVGFSGFAISGFNVNHLDIAPRYASILMGISNGFGTIAGMLCPVAVEFITKDQTKIEWSHIIMIASGLHFFGVTFYGIFASGEKQPWADPPKTEDIEAKPLEEKQNP